MTAAAPEGAIARRETSRPDLLAFEIRKKIPKADIEWMSGLVEEAFDRHRQVDMLIVMTNYEGSTLGAMFDGNAASAQARALGHVRRYAVVGAPGWAEAMIELSGKLSPVETKTFDLSEEPAAWRWVDGGVRS
jgi:hypothetical protein